MIHALEVAPFARRKGVGVAITRTAARWALGVGATPPDPRRHPCQPAGAGALCASRDGEVAAYHYRVAPVGASDFG